MLTIAKNTRITFRMRFRILFFDLLNPVEIVQLYNPRLEITRIVYEGRHNICYVIRDTFYILYVLDGSALLNVQLAILDTDIRTF